MGLIKIRKVLEKDKTALMDICESSFPTDDIKEIIDSLITLRHFYVAEELTSGKLLGFIVYSANSSKDISHILTLAVQPNSQREGIGTALINHMLRRLESTTVKKIRLEVRESNTAAIQFYQKLGFNIVGKINDYYAKGSDAFLMIKEII
ncbi:MAG: ribosomal-protein-alanine N-acetyltransferase [Candidatus Heimdallarchaeota archaeon]|nr:ribosomal-protein-alanine N-acetyltransferase [Candidatus Heimdallarchaeota archaeon]